MAQAQHQTTGKTPLTNLAGAPLLQVLFLAVVLVHASLPCRHSVYAWLQSLKQARASNALVVWLVTFWCVLD